MMLKEFDGYFKAKESGRRERADARCLLIGLDRPAPSFGRARPPPAPQGCQKNVSGSLNEEQWQFLSESAARGHEIIDHTTDHCMSREKATSEAQLKAEAAEVKRLFISHGLPAPKTWAQPGGKGVEPVAWKMLRDVYGKEFHYLGADGIEDGQPWSFTQADPNPDCGRWLCRPTFAYLDNKATLADMKHRAAEAVALNRPLTFVSHLWHRNLPGGWRDYLAMNKAFYDWLVASGIEVRTPAEWCEEVYETRHDRCNAFPQPDIDLDGDGVSDGYVVDSPAEIEVGRGCIRLCRRGGVHVRGLAGVERGNVCFGCRVKGDKGSVVTVVLQEHMRDPKSAALRTERSFAVDDVSTKTVSFSVSKDTFVVSLSLFANGNVELTSPVLK